MKYAILYFALRRSGGTWQTRWIQVPVSLTLVGVQIPPSAPNARLTQRESAILTRWKSLVRIQHRAPFFFLKGFSCPIHSINFLDSREKLLKVGKRQDNFHLPE